MQDQNPAALPAGGIFHGRYEVVRCIKAGGMGAVYEVIHLETRRRRALKVMLPSVVADPGLRARFRLEATVAAEVESEHIVETFDAGVDEATGAPFLVMELLRGEDLSALLERRGVLQVEEVVLLLSQVAIVLDKTHAAGVVHRDLKPANLFVTQRDDGSPRIKVLDYGIAKVVAQGATARQTQIIGTPIYMSPEQVRGEGTIGAASDLHALGHIAYTLLAGEPYWQEDLGTGVYALLLRITQGIVEAPSARALRRRGVALAAGFDAWFARATALGVGDRFATAKEMIGALAEAVGVVVGGVVPAMTAGGTLLLSNMDAETVLLPSTPPAEAPPIAPVEPTGARSIPGVTNMITIPLPSQRGPSKRPRALALGGVAVVGLFVGGVVLFGRGPSGAGPAASAGVVTSESAVVASATPTSAPAPTAFVVASATASATATGSAAVADIAPSASASPQPSTRPPPPPMASPTISRAPRTLPSATAVAPPLKPVAPPRPTATPPKPEPAYDPSKEM